MISYDLETDETIFIQFSPLAEDERSSDEAAVQVRSTNRMINKKAAKYCDTKQEQEDDDDSTTGESLVMKPSENDNEKDWYYL